MIGKIKQYLGAILLAVGALLAAVFGAAAWWDRRRSAGALGRSAVALAQRHADHRTKQGESVLGAAKARQRERMKELAAQAVRNAENNHSLVDAMLKLDSDVHAGDPRL